MTRSPSLSHYCRHNKCCEAVALTIVGKWNSSCLSHSDSAGSRRAYRWPFRMICWADDRRGKATSHGCWQQSYWTAFAWPAEATVTGTCPRTCAGRFCVRSKANSLPSSAGCRSWTTSSWDYRRISCYCRRPVGPCMSAVALLTPHESRPFPWNSVICKATTTAKRSTTRTSSSCSGKLRATPWTNWCSASSRWRADADGLCTTRAMSKCMAVGDLTTRRAWTTVTFRLELGGKVWMVARLCVKCKILLLTYDHQQIGLHRRWITVKGEHSTLPIKRLSWSRSRLIRIRDS